MNKYDYKYVNPFKWFILENFPFIEADFDALTNWQLFCKLGKEMNKIIDNLNSLGIETENLSQAFIDLQNYVNNYFENLDVQDEINNKLDEMAEDGTLQELIATYINSKTLWCFDNVEDMKNGTNLIAGSYAKTLGYYNINDGGGATYIILDNLVANSMNIIELDNGLFAKLVENSYYIEAKKYGAHCDAAADDTTILQNVINYAKENEREILIEGYSYVSNSIDTKGVKINGVGDRPYPDHTYTSKRYGYLGWEYLRNTGDGANITFDDYKDDILTTGSGIISDTANPILKCNNNDGQIKLENLSVVGWLRNENQVGIKTTYTSDDNYISGKHYFKNVSVFNCGSNGVELQSLELTEINNCDFSCNFGYGLYIEEVSNADCPFEYVTFSECYFRCNKLGGLYAKNSFRKSVVFENCFINRNGLYDQLNITPPSEISSLIAGITIDGRSVYDPVAHQQRIFKMDNCHGEEQNLLLKIDCYNSGWVFNDITISNCSLYPSLNTVSNALAYINTYYTKTLSYFNNYLNSQQNSLVLSSNSQKIIPNIVDKIFYDVYNYNPNVTVTSKITTALTYQKRYGNLVIINIYGTANSDIPAYESLLTNVPAPTSQLHPIIAVNNASVRGSVYVNGVCASTVAITNGQTVNIYLVYFTDYQN